MHQEKGQKLRPPADLDAFSSTSPFFKAAQEKPWGSEVAKGPRTGLTQTLPQLTQCVSVHEARYGRIIRDPSAPKLGKPNNWE